MILKGRKVKPYILGTSLYFFYIDLQVGKTENA